MVIDPTFGGGINKSWECTPDPEVESNFTERKLHSTIETTTDSAKLNCVWCQKIRKDVIAIQVCINRDSTFSKIMVNYKFCINPAFVGKLRFQFPKRPNTSSRIGLDRHLNL